MGRLLRRLALPALALAGLTIIIVAGFLARTNPAPLVGEPGLVAIIPNDGANILAQETVGAVLAPGYDGQLVLNGVTVPANQLDPNNAATPQLIFHPGPGKAVTALLPGKNCASITFWPVKDGPTGADPPTPWCFSVV